MLFNKISLVTCLIAMHAQINLITAYKHPHNFYYGTPPRVNKVRSILSLEMDYRTYMHVRICL
jgi:hypothetical protein